MDARRGNQLAQNDIEGREIDFLTVVGKAEPVRVYEIMAPAGCLSAAENEFCESGPYSQPDQLPESLKALSFRNGLQVDTGPDFDHHIERLMRAMDAALLGTIGAGAGPIDQRSTPYERTAPSPERLGNQTSWKSRTAHWQYKTLKFSALIIIGLIPLSPALPIPEPQFKWFVALLGFLALIIAAMAW